MIDVVIQGAAAVDVAPEFQRLTLADRVSPSGSRVVRFHGVQRTDGIPALARAHALDWAVLNPPLRRTDIRLLAMDMDSTLITIECIDQLADLAGIGKEVAEITEAAMKGELNFSQALKARVRLLAGLDESALARVFDERLRLSPGAGQLVRSSQEAGWKTLLVSGGFTYFTGRLQQELGLDYHHANTLEVQNGRLTGQVMGEVVDAAVKARTVEEVCMKLGCTRRQVIVVGDGANDLEMMAGAGLSVAYRAKPRVQEKATVSINHHGLDAILPLLLD